MPRLYAIADANTLKFHRISLRPFAEQLRDAGVTLLQYRDKDGSQQEVLEAAGVISEVFRGIACTLVMNDDPTLALAAGWGAVHLGQEDGAIAQARALMGPDAVIGYSTHNEEQVRAADAAGADYIAVGPVFMTGSKENPDPVIGLEGVRRARSLTRGPLVAIGGITLGNAASVIEAGADSVAVIAALATHDPGQAAREFLGAMPPKRHGLGAVLPQQ